jgi:hypothetical protein
VQRLRPLSEEECYLRIYGQRTDDAVKVVRPATAADRVAAAVVAERIRLAFEARLGAREQEAA